MTFLKTKKFWVSLLLAVVLLYPFQSTVVPPKSVLVVTEDWKPIEGARVRQTWQHYSLESVGHEQDLRTNEYGRVMFPPRTIRASVLRRLVHPVWNVLRQGVHASFGVHTDILDLNEGNQRRDVARIEPQAGEVIFRRR
jgi:hypothetical protein